MTFEQAAQIMMGRGKKAVIEPLMVTENGIYTPPTGVDGYSPITVSVQASVDGIWDVFGKIPPLAVITMGPHTLYYIYNLGDRLDTFMAPGVYYDNRYVAKKGYYDQLYAAVQVNGVFVYYANLSTRSGYSAIQEYEYVDGSPYNYFHRQTKIGAVHIDKLSLSASSRTATGLIYWYQDNLNFQQYDYSDGSHWEETYAWASTYSSFRYGFGLNFSSNEVRYSDNIRGSTINEKYNNWLTLCDDMAGASSGIFPIVSYTASENHFDKELYLNDAATSRGYYDNNEAYINKWGTSDMWT